MVGVYTYQDNARNIQHAMLLNARRPVQMRSWAPGGLSGGRIGRHENRPEAVLDAMSGFGRAV